jgi:hypothetical protein
MARSPRLEGRGKAGENVRLMSEGKGKERDCASAVNITEKGRSVNHQIELGGLFGPPPSFLECFRNLLHSFRINLVFQQANRGRIPCEEFGSECIGEIDFDGLLRPGSVPVACVAISNRLPKVEPSLRKVIFLLNSTSSGGAETRGGMQVHARRSSPRATYFK